MDEIRYQIDTRKGIRVGRDDELAAEFRAGWFIKDLSGEVAGEAVKLTLAAPWRGMRYRVTQGGRELASAGKPRIGREGVAYELEIPGRTLELKSEDRYNRVYRMRESDEETGCFTRLDYGRGDRWTAEFTTRESSVAFAAFVAFLVREAGIHHRT